ncbi:MAG: A/G-specific adenine glycosylase [candidate division Zixibacteria bacterium]|nr:A/G-specific adenine glycosylase [candidate division Zixibacteria bacterium]
MNDADLTAFRVALMEWYQTHKRDLPWRNTCDPYAVWISEMMLQQTRVAQAQPYFERFMTRFPTVRVLADADIDEVLKLWEGLGYYARARNLHRAARRILDEHGGRIPDERDVIAQLPGIGPYSAAAILSIAYGKDEAVVDGNVIRVLVRLFLMTEPSDTPAFRRRAGEMAAFLLWPGRAADFNQAMMELGATICTPRSPRCAVCPVRHLCGTVARMRNPETLPCRRPRRARPHHAMTAGIILHNDRVLIVQRPMDGLLGGLWEFPGGRLQDGELPEEGFVREIRSTFGLEVGGLRYLAAIRHAFTHFEITLHGFLCEWISGERAYPSAVWVTETELAGFAFSSAHNRLMTAWRENATSAQLRLL